MNKYPSNTYEAQLIKDETQDWQIPLELMEMASEIQNIIDSIFYTKNKKQEEKMEDIKN